MTRYWYGDSDDFTIGVTPAGNVRVRTGFTRYYSAQIGGTQYSDLLIGGNPATEVPSTGIPVRFQGPDGVLSMWAGFTDVTGTEGPRVLVMSTDTQSVIASLSAAAVAVGNSNDTIIAGRVNAGGSATDVALRAKYINEGVTRWDLTKYGIATDGTTLADTAFDALLGNMKPGDVLDVPHGATIKLGNRRDLAKPITFEFNEANIVQSSSVGVFRVVPGGDGSKFRNLKGVGPSGTTYQAASTLVAISGTVSSYVEDVSLENVVGQSWGTGTLDAKFARRVRTRDVLTKSCMYVGQIFNSCEDVALYNPMCDTLQGLSGNSNAYPVAFTRDSVASLTTNPRTRNARVFGGYAKNVPWEGLDVHGAQDVKVFGYDTKSTAVGVAFVGSAVGSTVTYAPIDCWAHGCTSESGVSDGSAGEGFTLAGAAGLEWATGGFVGCTAIGHGTQGDTSGGSAGFRFSVANGARLVSSTAIECSPHAASLALSVNDLIIDDLVAVDPWSTGTTITGVVGIVDNNQSLTLSNTRLRHGSKSATNLNSAGIYAHSALTGVDVIDGGGNDFSIASSAPYVNLATGALKMSHFGVKSARPTLTSSSTTAQIVAALQQLGLAQ